MCAFNSLTHKSSPPSVGGLVNNPSSPRQGDNSSGWIIIDTGDVIVHLFKKESREFYNLEKMWSVEIE